MSCSDFICENCRTALSADLGGSSKYSFEINED